MVVAAATGAARSAGAAIAGVQVVATSAAASAAVQRDRRRRTSGGVGWGWVMVTFVSSSRGPDGRSALDVPRAAMRGLQRFRRPGDRLVGIGDVSS
ncbi:hypothetical protein Cma02nite_04510 [Cellulomonas marina]|nr:hypothetical protein Cma02nite_04510 [Cellulomonas marina]